MNIKKVKSMKRKKKVKSRTHTHTYKHAHTHTYARTHARTHTGALNTHMQKQVLTLQEESHTEKY